MQIEFRNISRRVCLELLVFIMQIDRDIKLGILLLEQSCTDTTAVFLLENKALRIIVIERKHLQIVTSRTEVFISLRACMVNICDRRGRTRLTCLSCA